MRHRLASVGLVGVVLISGLALVSAIQPPLDGNLVAPALFVAIVALTVFRPADGLLVLAGGVALGEVVGGLLGSRLRIAEAFVLAVLFGWSLRRAAGLARGRRPGRPGLLELAALLMAIVALASVLEGLAVRQILTDRFGVFCRDLVEEFLDSYLLPRREWSPLAGAAAAASILEGLALLLVAAWACAGLPAMRRRLTAMLAAGAAGAAVLSLARLFSVALRSGDPAALLAPLSAGLRVTSHVADPNAAGSHFAMMIPVALGQAVAARGLTRVAWCSLSLVLAAGLLLSGSRTALAALAVALLIWAFWGATRSAIPPAATLGFAALALIAAGWFVSFEEHEAGAVGPGAVQIRWWFMRTSLAMWATAPLFGVGIGGYLPASPRFMPPELLFLYPREHAHNYFLEVAAELGIAGLLAFVLVLGVALTRAASVAPRLGAGSRGNKGAIHETAGAICGMGVFLATCLAGHPFLVPPVAFSFWLLLGAHAGGGSAPVTEIPLASERGIDVRQRWPRILLVAGLSLVAVLPFRVHRLQASIDMRSVAYGLSEWQTDGDGRSFRWASSRASFFVDGSASVVEFPLRAAPDAGGARALEIDLSIDGRRARTLRLGDDFWYKVRLPVSRPASPYHRVDLVVDVASDRRSGSDDGPLVMLGEVRTVRDR